MARTSKDLRKRTEQDKREKIVYETICETRWIDVRVEWNRFTAGFTVDNRKSEQ